MGNAFLPVGSLGQAQQQQRRVVATGFSWAENLHFDGQGNLFVSDFRKGHLVRVWWDAATQSYAQEIHLQQGFHRFLGIASTPGDPWVYVVAQQAASSEYVVVKTMATQPERFEVVAYLKGMGNGLAMHDGFLYTAMEGDFLPGEGRVFRIDPWNGNVTLLNGALWSADGVYILQVDAQPVLLVSQLLDARLWAFDVSTNQSLGRIAEVQHHTWMDDFCAVQVKNLHAAGNRPTLQVYGAGFLRGEVVTFQTPLPPPESNTSRPVMSVIADGFKSPTSVRPGTGKGFRSTSLYVSEGGGLFASDSDRSIIELVDILKERESFDVDNQPPL